MLSNEATPITFSPSAGRGRARRGRWRRCCRPRPRPRCPCSRGGLAACAVGYCGQLQRRADAHVDDVGRRRASARSIAASMMSVAGRAGAAEDAVGAEGHARRDALDRRRSRRRCRRRACRGRRSRPGSASGAAPAAGRRRCRPRCRRRRRSRSRSSRGSRGRSSRRGRDGRSRCRCRSPPTLMPAPVRPQRALRDVGAGHASSAVTRSGSRPAGSRGSRTCAPARPPLTPSICDSAMTSPGATKPRCR